MKLSHFCIKRPVFTVVLSLVLIVLGIIGFSRLQIRQFPNISFPEITVETFYPGANASLVESEITTPIEDVLSNIDGLSDLESSSMQDDSFIHLKFDLATDLNVAAGQVRDKLDTVVNRLPNSAQKPSMYRFGSDDWSIFHIAIDDETRSLMAVTDYVTKYVKPKLEQIDGIAKIDLDGSRNYSMRMWLDADKMAAHKTTASDIVNALKAQNVAISSGQIKSKQRYYSVVTQSQLSSVEQFNNIVISDTNGYLVRFRDVGRAEIAPQDTDAIAYFNGKQVVFLSIYGKANANPIEIAKQVTKELPEIQAAMPAGMHLQVAFDGTKFVRSSLQNTVIAVVEAVALVITVVFLFLGSLRSTLIPVVTIPICLITSLGCIYLLGFSINTFTLLALVLAIGLVVDDAIVMLENVHRHVEHRMVSFQAALVGSQEIGFAIIAMTITLAAVYIPIAFTPGMMGVVFREFAFTLAVAVIISGFVALTLSPMMCARIVKVGENKYSVWLDYFFHRLIVNYQRLLNSVLKYRVVIIGVLLGLIVVGALVQMSMTSELSPVEDYGVIKTQIQPPTNSSFDYTEFYSKQVYDLYRTIPEVTNSFMFIMPSDGFGIAVLKPWDERKRSAKTIADQLNQKLAEITGVTAFNVRVEMLGGGGKHGDAVTFAIMTTQSYPRLNVITQDIIKELKKWPGFGDIDSSLKMDSEQFELVINRDLAADLHVDMGDIADTIATMLGGSKVTKFNVEGFGYDVILQLPPPELEAINIIKQLAVRNKDGAMIPLANLVTINKNIGAVELSHYNRLRAAKIVAQLNSGFTVGSGVDAVRKVMKVNLPDDAKYTFNGAAKRFIESNHQMALVFILALVFIYLVLSAQFESFIDPLIILFSVPLAMVGALLTLRLAGGTLNIYSDIGFVTLIGLVAKHGILITNFANQLRQQGRALHESVVEAASLRLRPILMTTAAMAIGALPLIFASGAGANANRQIGWVIVGGLIFGTFFSLLVVPVAYSFLGRFHKLH